MSLEPITYKFETGPVTMSNMTSTVSNTTYHGRPWSMTTTVILSALLICIMISAVLGNLMVISVILRHKGMRTKANLFLLNLAIADFLVGCTMIPFSLATLIKGGWEFGKALCTLNGVANATFFIVSIHTLMYISIHKYFSIRYPLSRWFTLCKIYIILTFVWCWAVLFSALTTWLLTEVLYKRNTMQCGPKYPDYDDLRSLLHHLINQIFNIFLPIVIIVFTQIRLLLEIRGHARRLKRNSSLEKDTIVAQQKRVTITIFIVVIVFILCWIPYHVYAMISTEQKEDTPFMLNATAYFFGYLNSSCNPIIYAFRSNAFRAGYQEILCQTPKYQICDGPMGRPYVRTISGSSTTASKKSTRTVLCSRSDSAFPSEQE